MKTRKMWIGSALLVVALAACFVATSSAISLKSVTSTPKRQATLVNDQTTIAKISDSVDLTDQGYTVFGKWMINTSKNPNYPANWLARTYPDPADGNKKKAIVEPINIVIVDTTAKTAEDAIKKLDSETLKAGYARWFLHSAGYKAYIKDDFHWQLFNGGSLDFTCYQTKFPLETNNHGRIFGPVRVGNAWIFTAAFSREKALNHDYISFLRAATDFAKQMNDSTCYKNIGKVSLDNVIVRSDQFTGDHDGFAIVLKRK